MSQQAYKIIKIDHEQERTFDSQNEVIMQMLQNEISDGNSIINVSKSDIEEHQKELENGDYDSDYTQEHRDEAKTILEKMLADCGKDESVDYFYV